MHSRTRSLFVALLVVLCTAGAAFAQSGNVTTGAIGGTVSDTSGGALPGVTVTATNTQTGLTRNTVTEGDGTYVLQLLQPGTYRVEASLEGLGTAQRPTVQVLLGNTTDVDLVINPQLSEQITVTAEAPVVDTRQSGLTASVTQEQIENLPILGRDFRDLALLTPGAVTSFGERVAFNGGRGIATDYNIDGADTNSDFFGEQRGGTRAPFTFSQAAIREFQVIRSVFSAEYAKGSGGTLNAITKSGTNDFKGEVFYYTRKASWASERPITNDGLTISDTFLAKDVDQYGAAIGGPIMRDKLFFFVNTDWQDFSRGVIANDFRTDTDFLALTPAQQQQFIQRVEQLIGGPVTDEFNFQTTDDQRVYMLKLDANIGTKHHVAFRDNLSTYENLGSEGTTPFSNNGVFENNFNSAVLTAESVLTDQIFNQAILQFSTEERPRTPTVTSIMSTQIQDIGYTFGQSDFLPSDLVEDKWQFKDNVSFHFGQHNVKVGGEYVKSEMDNLFPREFAGRYRFSNVADFLAGRPNLFAQGLGPAGNELGSNQFEYQTWGIFVHDTWTRNNLTLDFGVRYDQQSMPKPVANVAPTRPEFIENFNEDTDNIAPRLGFAWDVAGNGRSVLRGGVGRYYNFLPSILLANPLAQIGGLFTRISVTCATATPCPTYPNIFSRAEFDARARLASDITLVSPDLEAMENTRAVLGFEQQLGTSYSVGIEGTYSMFEKQQRLVNINATPTGRTFGNLTEYRTNATNRRYPDFNNVLMHVSDAEANYKSLTLSTKKLAAGTSRFTWMAHYTWAEAIDQDSNERSTSAQFSIDPYDPELNEGFADYDVRHKFVASATYEAPFGVMLSGIFNFRTGQPYTPSVSGLTNGLSTTNFTPLFLDRDGNVINLAAAFPQSAPGTLDQIAAFLNGQGATLQERNSERHPSYYNLDMRVSKVFNVWSDMSIEVLAEVFNVLDTKIFNVPGANRTLYTRANGATANTFFFRENANYQKENAYDFYNEPRQIQAAVKLRF
jgi:Carboxypeptidase regulatory-like domain